ncbi:hypothetical protein [Idiomarina abyssalis]|uniref:hypothetical protein n=1 Tax=Idiomarina abyssalis TaxID=86102 RepID=UPI003A91093A
MKKANNKTERFGMRVEPEFWQIIDDWRRNQSEIPTRASAVRSLIIAGLSGQERINGLITVVEKLRFRGKLPEDIEEEVKYVHLKAIIKEDAFHSLMGIVKPGEIIRDRVKRISEIGYTFTSKEINDAIVSSVEIKDKIAHNKSQPK